MLIDNSDALTSTFRNARIDTTDTSDPPNIDPPIPSDIGLPPQFARFRPDQWEAITHAVYSRKRFTVLCAPTGMGKSLIARTLQLISGGVRSAILTSTKGLADQYQRDFGEPVYSKVARRITGSGTGAEDYLFDIRGKNNYQCAERPQLNCDDGARMLCSLQPGLKCTYHATLHTTRQSLSIGTNYSYWMHIQKQGRGTGLNPINGLSGTPIKLLILDEAHMAPDELTKFLAVRIGEREVSALLNDMPPQTEDIDEWRVWAGGWSKWISDEVKEQSKKLTRLSWKSAQPKVAELAKLEGLGRRLEQIVATVRSSGGGDWICEEKVNLNGTGKVWEFEPVYPGIHAESTLFCDIPKVVMISAVKVKTPLLGIKGNDVDYREWPRVFPRNRNQIYHFPAVRMNYRTSDKELRVWVEAIDTILDSRALDRKGLIHTVSYERQEYLMTHSRHRKRFIGNTSDPNSETAQEAVERFRKSKPPAILVSPSFATGWDFPGDQCEFIVIAKIPWPVTRSRVMRERIKRDPQYSNGIAMQELVQMSGRGMRFELDRCEVFIVDDGIGFFMATCKGNGSVPKWFEVRRLGRDENTGVGALPVLPPKL